MALEFKWGQARFECFVPVLFGKLLECVEEGCDPAFRYVGADVRPCAELVNAEVELGHGFLGGRYERSIICKPDAGYRVGLCDGVSESIEFEPSG